MAIKAPTSNEARKNTLNRRTVPRTAPITKMKVAATGNKIILAPSLIKDTPNDLHAITSVPRGSFKLGYYKSKLPGFRHAGPLATTITREALGSEMMGLASQGREIRYDGMHCNLIIQRFLARVVVLRISGCDVGEFGEAPMKALNDSVTSSYPIDLFIDARDVTGASIDVSGEWARWLSSHKPGLRTITMLTGSRFIEITAAFVRRFASLEGIMKICSEPAVFDFALAETLKRNDKQHFEFAPAPES